MARETRVEWAKRVERWKRSGLTAKKFAAREGVRPGALSWWKWHLRKRPSVSAPPVVEVVGLALAPMSESSAIEVVLHSGVRLVVPASFDAESLARLLTVLEGR